jgi:hypothetical protein
MSCAHAAGLAGSVDVTLMLPFAGRRSRMRARAAVTMSARPGWLVRCSSESADLHPSKSATDWTVHLSRIGARRQGACQRRTFPVCL